MSNQPDPTPPQFPLKFLRWFCQRDMVEDVEGDLVELYEKRNTKNKTKAKLFDIHGRVISTHILNTTETRQSIDVSHLSSGIYILELESNTSQRRIKKLVIQ